MDYQALRTFADSWGLLFMTLAFVAMLLWVLRPGGRAAQDDASQIPFRDEEAGQ